MDFINQSTIEVAKELLGKKLLINHNGVWVGGYIVETEAYLGVEDMACHSYNGRRTPKVFSLYEIGGTIYIYVMHSHHMLNIVTRDVDVPEAVLIRAIQPVEQVKYMLMNRKIEGINISNGPGKLTKAMGITKDLDGTKLNVGQLIIDEVSCVYPKNIITSPRIGIPNKEPWTGKPLRFYVEGNPYVSRIKKREMKEVEESWKV
ncbi:MAG: DNA-3-methyladenine glycosylase [Defluviitaleaceae bacterium]|nr:DNA-3-methyladenine glycosylase [Defluviitaleaceae bacterium]